MGPFLANVLCKPDFNQNPHAAGVWRNRRQGWTIGLGDGGRHFAIITLVVKVRDLGVAIPLSSSSSPSSSLSSSLPS